MFLSLRGELRHARPAAKVVKVWSRLKLWLFFEAGLKIQNPVVQCLTFIFTSVAINCT